MTAYTEQDNAVAERLNRGEIHIQPWSDSAAYDSQWPRPRRLAYKRAYFWMARQFKEKMKRPLTAAPVWLFFDYDVMIKLHNIYEDRVKNTTVITLCVPRDEILFSDHELWMKYVLQGYCVGDDVPSLPAFSCNHTGKQRRATWASIFGEQSELMKMQGTVDRIDPAWVLKSTK